MPDDFTGGPFLQVAVFCEKILNETDGVASLVRIVDRWMVNGTSETLPLTIISTNLVLMMKSGIYRGRAVITITPETPSGKKLPPISIQMQMEGDNDRGVTTVVPLQFPVQEEGLYWFSVSLEDLVLTKMPFRIQYQRVLQAVRPSLPPNPADS